MTPDLRTRVGRRAFTATAGLGAAALSLRVLDGGRVVGPWTRSFGDELYAAGPAATILLHNNENPLGPGERAITAIRAQLSDPGIPAARYTSLVPDLSDALAARHRCRPENVLVGCGSTQILRSATFAYASAARPLVAGSPTYEECAGVARLIGAPIRAVPGRPTLHHDLEAMIAAANGAGMVFFDNPGNPAATVHGAADVASFVERVLRASPGTTILFDEAYHDYVTDPAYRTQIPLALHTPRVIVARTFSKAYGMAGLRVGYAIAHVDTIARMRALQYPSSTNALGLAAALATLADDERLAAEQRRNAEVRAFTLDWFRQAGCTPTESQANFVFVNVGRPARGVREACARQGVLVGRDFPPYERTHVRISIGTAEEMRRATEVFGRLLGHGKTRPRKNTGHGITATEKHG
ncbi:MAG TPA: histidinol-phosphate transaminase [Vicinamibacterales bacterium]|nr:histidinol-phosphate transaminase [Vicinamibacterales bacterium]